jgi:hypothetical protein
MVSCKSDWNYRYLWILLVKIKVTFYYKAARNSFSSDRAKEIYSTAFLNVSEDWVGLENVFTSEELVYLRGEEGRLASSFLSAKAFVFSLCFFDSNEFLNMRNDDNTIIILFLLT